MKAIDTIKHYYKWHLYYRFIVPTKLYKTLGCPVCALNDMFRSIRKG